MFTILKLNLDQDSKMYQPGSDLKGAVQIKGIKHDVHLAGLTVQLVGTANTLQVQGPYSELREEVTVCDEELVLFPADSNETSSRHRNEFPFALHIPEDAPSSVFLTLHNQIKYKIKAWLPNAKGVRPVERNVYLLASKDDVKISQVEMTAAATVPLEPNDQLIIYGNGSHRLSHEEMQKYPVVTESEVNGESSGKSTQVYFSALMPNPGIYTDDPISIPSTLVITGRQPPLMLRSLRVVIEEDTQINARGQGNKEVTSLTLYHFLGKRSLTHSGVHDLTDEIAQNAKLPRELPPDFSTPTITRSYNLNIHLMLYKGDETSQIPINLIHLNVRRPINILGRRFTLASLPSFSSYR